MSTELINQSQPFDPDVLTLQVEIYIYIVNISTWSLFMLDMYQIN